MEWFALQDELLIACDVGGIVSRPLYNRRGLEARPDR